MQELHWIFRSTFKAKSGDKNKNNKLMPLRLDDDKVLEKYKIIWVKIEDLKNIELDALQVYNDRYIKTKIRTYGGKVYNNFGCFNVPEDVECRCRMCFTITSIDSLHFYEIKYYLQVSC